MSKVDEIQQTTNMFKGLMDNKDTNERHQFLVAGHRFNVDKYYQPHKAVGSGAYGVVCSAIDSRYNCKIAIKKCTNAFEDVIDGKRILREIKLLQFFDHENVIKLHDMIPPANSNMAKFNDVYLVEAYMESDLHKIIYSKNKLTDEHYAYFTYQILRGLKYIHSCRVIHRDLKPSNLLVNSNCDLKICDFGLARGLNWSAELTEYVVTRWYRAPEIMCSHQDYNEGIDIWSVGTILAEMIKRKPLFPGGQYIEQLNLIFELIGTPAKSDLECVSNVKAFNYIQKLFKKPAKSFDKYFTPYGASKNAIDLLKKMLVFNPNKRISVDEALEHPYFSKLHNKAKETECIKTLNFSWELKCKDRKGLKEQMLKTCVEIRGDANKKWANKQKQKPQKEQ